MDHGKCFQDAPDLSQLQPGLVAKDKPIRQKASLFGEWLTYRTIFHLVPSMLVICESWLVTKSARCTFIRDKRVTYFGFFAGEDDCDECYCGFSAVINRKMSHMAGLFYEDEAEITSITEDREQNIWI